MNGDARDLPISATSQEEENDSTDTESNADSKINNDNGESSSCADNSEETKRADENVGEKKEDSIKQSDGKRKAFPRYYDRSMLSAEELESLRRREREYQRRRRARLREAKVAINLLFLIIICSNSFLLASYFSDKLTCVLTQHDCVLFPQELHTVVYFFF